MDRTSLRPGPTRLLLPLLAALAVGVGACSDDPLVPQTIEDTVFDPGLQIDLSQMQLLPSGVYVETLEAGAGDEVAAPDSARVDYAVFLSNGLLADGGTFTFQLGAGGVIDGFEIGVTGMQEGEIRRFIVPWELAYGAAGAGGTPGIPPYANLVFRVELLEIIPTDAGTTP